MQRLAAPDYVHMPWKNGGGMTEQIAISPPGATLASGFVWRVSRAQVASDGPFSHFPGCDRILVICAGAGVELHHTGARQDETVTLGPLEPFLFAGEAPIVSHLRSGAIADFNVVFDRAFIAAECHVRRLTKSVTYPATPHTSLLHCLRGACTSAPHTIATGDSLILSDEVVHLTADEAPCVLLEVRLSQR